MIKRSKRERARSGAYVAAVTAALALTTQSAAGAQSAEAVEAGAADDREVIVVTGRARALYRVLETEAGKLPNDPLDSPLTIQVINDELISDQGARDAQDLYRNFSGVSVFSYAGVTARGFRQEEIFYDGLRGDPYVGFAVPQLFNVAQVEFLKGPAGMLYGPGAPGGLFNYVTKRPEADFAARAAVVAGTEARYGASGEITGAITALPGAAGRLGVFYEDRNTPRIGSGNETLILDAGLTFDLGFADLILQATRYDQDLAANRLRGVPVDTFGRFITDRRWNHNEPIDFLRLESTVLQAKLEGAVDAALIWDVALRWNDADETQAYHEPSGLADTDNDGVFDLSRREYRAQERTSESLSFGANAVWSHDFGAFQNRILVGLDRFNDDSDFSFLRARGDFVSAPGSPEPLSLTDPQYGLSDPSTYVLSVVPRTPSSLTRTGGYILEEATLGPVIGTLGVRFDRFEDDDGSAVFEDERASWRAGLVYKARDDVSLYAQWAESFEPQGASDQDVLAGGPFEPTQGAIIEGGVRTALLDGRVQSTLAIYEIVRSNILQADPRGDVGGDGVDDFIAIGEVTSQGAEIDVAADITDNWVFTASYAYNDTRITADNGGGGLTNRVGEKFANAPEHTLGFWTRYQFGQSGFAAALGGDYVDVRQSLSGQKVRPYAVFDASLIYGTEGWRTLLRVDNLFDETYAASGFIDRTGHFPGEPRSVFVEIAREW